MASKNEKLTECSNQLIKSTTQALITRVPVVDGDNTEKSKNTEKVNGEVCQETTGKANKKTEDQENVFKSRAKLEKEVAEKSQRLDSLEFQLKQLQETLRSKEIEETQEISARMLYETTKVELTKAQDELKNLADLRKKNSDLSEENYNLRERLVKKNEDIERLNEARADTKARNVSFECKTSIHKILRKENVELHYEKEQLKIERDRLRHTLKEKQDQFNKMSSSMGDLEEQLFQAKRALEDRVKTSSRLEDRLAKLDTELNRYRERFAKLEKQNKKLADQVKSGNATGLEKTDIESMSENQKENRNQRFVALLQNKEEKLLRDRCQLEKEVNQLNGKIKELEAQLHNCRPEKRPTNERGSQTDLGPGVTHDMLTKSKRLNKGGLGLEKESPADETAVRKCKGIVKSLGKFFEELIQNHQDSCKGSSRGRRTAIAARRANELLQELSVSMDHLVSPKTDQPGESTKLNNSATTHRTAFSSDGRKSGANNERTLWDKLSQEVARHEFAFDQTSPTNENHGLEVTNDKDKEVRRAENALQRLYQSGSPCAGKSNTYDKLTKEDVSNLMQANRKETEILVRELLHKHHGEMKALVENACQSSAIPVVELDLCDANMEGSGNSEASLAVQELDNFKARAAKVQSLILKMQTVVESEKNDRENVLCQLQVLEDELQRKETLLQAKGQELRRRHCKTLELEKSFQEQIESLTLEKDRVGIENSRLNNVCRQKDQQIVEKSQEVKRLHAEIAEREKAHQQNLSKMRKKVEEAWNQYTTVKSRAEKRCAEFNEAAEKLKVSQGYLLDLWQTLKTVDNVVDTAENDDI